MTDDEFEEKMQDSYKTGKAAGLNLAAKMLMDRALAAFADRADDRAKLFRELADDFAARAKGPL